MREPEASQAQCAWTEPAGGHSDEKKKKSVDPIDEVIELSDDNSDGNFDEQVQGSDGTVDEQVTTKHPCSITACACVHTCACACGQAGRQASGRPNPSLPTGSWGLGILESNQRHDPHGRIRFSNFRSELSMAWGTESYLKRRHSAGKSLSYLSKKTRVMRSRMHMCMPGM